MIRAPRRLSLRRARLVLDDSGQSLVVTALTLAVLLLCASLAVDTAHWFVHKRHLQTQADAGALAAARQLQFPCGATAADPPNPSIIAVAHQYDGYAPGAYNAQISNPASPAPVSGTVYSPSAHNLFSLVNAASFINQSIPNDTDVTGDPCKDGAVDLKLTETNTPWFFKLAGVDYINAQARVTIQKLVSTAYAAPIAIQSSTPNSVYANLVDESSGASLGGAELSTTDSGQTWTNTSPMTMTYTGSVGSRIGVRIGLSGAPTAGSSCSTTGPTFCFDSTSPNNGLWMVHTWDNPSGTVGLPVGAGMTPVGPVVKDAWLSSGPGVTGCANTSFTALSTACTVVLNANLQFTGSNDPNETCTANPSSNVQVQLTVAGGTSGTSQMNCPPGASPVDVKTGVWTSNPITIQPNSGPTTFQLDYTLQSGEQKPAGAGSKDGVESPKNSGIFLCKNGNTCSNSGSVNGFGIVTQRIFAGAPDLSQQGNSRSGSISNVALTDATTGAPLVNDSLQRCQVASCTKSLNVTVGIFPLASTNDINAPAINLRASDPQGNGAINCGQGTGTKPYAGALLTGCPNTLTKAPSGATSAICATQPNSCVSVVPGNGKVTDALDGRIACRSGCTNGDGSVGQASVPATKCDNPNFWTPPNNLALMKSRVPVDPRLVQLIIVPYGALAPNGQYAVPIKDFASFYITGYDSTGSQNTCQDAGIYTSPGSGSFTFLKDTPTSGGNNNHEVWGHFVIYNDPSAGGTGSGTCDPNVASDCIAVLTK